MPLAKKAEGYPVEDSQAATATVEKAPESAPRTVQSSTTTVQPSAKDRSIIRQTAWKVVAMSGLANYVGSPEAWLEKALELQAKIEKHMLES